MRDTQNFHHVHSGRVRCLVAFAVGVAMVTPATSFSASTRPRFGTTTLFADVPAPGHPFGVLPTDDGVYVATSAGSPFRPNTAEEAVFKFPVTGGEPEATTPVMTMPTMGLHDMAVDGDGRLYVVDMNSRILRFPRQGGMPEVYASVPEPFASLGWTSSMWQNLAFDRNGDLYVTDAAQGAIWRIPPNGKPEVWFSHPDLLSYALAGVNGIAFGPDHKLYVVLASSASPQRLGRSVLYRLPMGSAPPRPDQLEVVHEFAVSPGRQPSPFPVAADLAFGASGTIYLSLTGFSEIAVLKPDGSERRITDVGFDVPIGIRFQGDSLLVANSNYFFPEDQDHWQILKVFVGEPGRPLIRPHIPDARTARHSS